MSSADPAGQRAWHEIVRDVLKENNVRLVTYVPDNVLSPLIRAAHADPFFTTFCCTREEEAVGICTGAWMGGTLGIVLMQTSGFATLPNVLASLAVPYQIPLLMIISERGTLGEFNLGQAMVCRTMRPSLDSMGIENHTLRRLDEVEFVVGRTVQQAVSTQAPAALILNAFLTGGKVEEEGELTMTSNQRKIMNRADLTKRLVGKLKNDEAVVGGIGFTNFELWGAGQRPQNFYMLGSMGLALPIALGVALAQPKRKVIGLEGDGSLLMQVGALGTIANLRQKNLVMVVWDNGAYQITGGQPAVTATVVDLVGLAQASGLDKAYWAKDEGHFDQLIDRALSEDGPFFIAAKIDNQRPAATTHRDPVQIRERFMRGLGVRKEPQAGVGRRAAAN